MASNETASHEMRAAAAARRDSTLSVCHHLMTFHSIAFHRIPLHSVALRCCIAFHHDDGSGIDTLMCGGGGDDGGDDGGIGLGVCGDDDSLRGDVA